MNSYPLCLDRYVFEDMSPPTVGIIVLNWNGKSNTRECLSSLHDLNYESYFVTVVDNNSSDGSVSMIKEDFSDVDLIKNEENKGFTGGFNSGIKHVDNKGAKYTVCLNNDVAVDEDFLNELVSAGESLDDVGALAPMELQYDNPTIINYAGGDLSIWGSTNFGQGEKDVGQYDNIHQTDMLCGPAMVFRTDVLREIGMFDEDYFFNWEDKDIATRIQNNGFNIYFIPNAKIWHKGRGSTEGAIGPIRTYFHLRNYLLFVQKNYTPIPIPFYAYFLLIYFPYIVYTRLIHGEFESARMAIMAILWHTSLLDLPNDREVVRSHYKK